MKNYPSKSEGSGQYPQLTLKETESLQVFGADTLPEQRIFAAPLADVVDRVAPGREWLEAAVFAGYVPHFEGIVLGLFGTYLLWTREIAKELAAGAADGDSQELYGSAVEMFRNLMRLADHFANCFEQQCPPLGGRSDGRRT